MPLRIAGVLLLAVPFLPLRRVFGELQGASHLVPPGEWALGLAIFAVVAWLVALVAGDRAPDLEAAAGLLDRGEDRWWLAAGTALLSALLVAASRGAFHGSPHLIDSVVQLFQAKIFASGALEAPPPPGDGFFATQHMIVDGNGWYSQYPPGHAALLSVGVTIGAPWLVPVLLSVAAAVFLFAAVRRIYGSRCARLTLVLLALCPFFWFMGASFMNHVSALFGVALFLYLFVRWEESRSVGWALAAGAALGVAALSRPLTAAAVLVPFALFGALSVGIDGRGEARAVPGAGGWPEAAGHILVAGAGFGVVASLYLLYNAQVTGDPLLPGYLKLWGQNHGLGFHDTPWGGHHTPVTGLRNELVDLSLLNLFLFEWPVPALLPVGAVFAMGWTGERWDGRLLAAFLVIPSAYFFYWHRDSFLGPRFLYSGVAFLLPLTARSLLAAGDRLRGRSFQIGELFRPLDAGRWAAVLLLLCGAYAVFFSIPQRFRVYATGMPSMKADVRREARRAGVERGLIFVKVSWGNRIMARMRGSGVPAGLTVRAYRNVGHCDLHELLERASDQGWTGAEVSARVERMIARGDSLVRTGRLNGDRTLRLRAHRRLSAECREEIGYDEAGYTNYTPQLVANTPDLSGRFVVARDLRRRNGELRPRFRARKAYLYDGQGLRPFPVPPERRGGETASVRLWREE